ncbi:MAG: chitobiase/beta-hexosaminidase C-terminal domain-containing protein, partial [Muribaculaceae bacterium]|nr:chitobiase/beta-hexosaminidase C-terminal domain-containing protein [Muribaculaceae bacterium]
SLEIKKNCTLYAKAVRDGYYDSETEIITINSLADSVPVPVISFENGMVEISCANDAAEIHYTIDNPDITTESPLYTEAFRLDRNATIRALAVIPGLDIEPSGIVTRVIDSFKVATPTGSFDPQTRLLRIICSTEQAKILYSVDSENDWTEYGDPISITRNCTVYAEATRDGWNDSDVASIQVTELADNVPAPVISFEDGMVEITCSNTSAEIHYTIDDENLTAESPRYEGRFALDRNATIRAFSLIPGLDIEPSGIVTRVIDSFKVATPTGSFDPQTRLLRIICSTEQAKILYSVDSENDWTEYGDPISITRNCTVYAEATRDGWNDSDVASIQVTELADNVPAPVISFEDGMVEITCSNTSAEIHYTIDDENLTAESPRYEGRFALDRNATIRAFALIPDLDIEPSGIVTRVIDSFKAATPYGDFNAGTRMLTILCDTEDASIFYSYDRNEDWIPYTGPIAIEGNRTVYAKATRDGWNDSEIADIVISDVKCAGVSIDYKGHNVTLKTDEEGATIRYTTDGNEPSGGLVYTEPFDPEGLCTVRAVAVKSGYMNSDIAEEVITRYADEEHAETSAEGLLASAFDWDESGLPNKVESFRVAGRLNDADYEFLRSMEALRHLDLEDVADARIPENAFRDTRLISISLPEDITACGDGILADTPNLSSVVWNSRTMNVGDGFIRDLTNPNTLLYVTKEASVSGADGLNIVREGVEPSVTLHYGYPYYAARDFRAARVSLTHEFLQTTKVDTCRGWETIVLPFTPTSITHEVNGPIVPFAAWNEDVEGDKPFWLYSATETGWEAGDSIRACVPYIISMPNNPDYVKEFILGGKVTFSADGVYLGPDSSFADSNPWMEGMRFEGTFMPVEDSNLHSLNVNSTEGGLQPGSKFIPGGSTPPFGAYVSGGPGRRAIPLFGNSDLVDVPLIVDAGLLIETPAPGVLKICSGRECKVAVTTATGVTLRTLHLKPGEAQTLEGLTRDLYIVAGRKVMVR